MVPDQEYYLAYGYRVPIPRKADMSNWIATNSDGQIVTTAASIGEMKEKLAKMASSTFIVYEKKYTARHSIVMDEYRAPAVPREIGL